MKALTDRQGEVLDYIKSCRLPPTLRAIGAQFGFSHEAAHQHVKALEKKGYLERLPFASRGLIVKQGAVG